jgi:polyhydroxyalkanoate synthesis regulator phasin
VIDSLRTYVTLVTGVTEATAAKAKEVASGLLDQGFARFAGTESVQALADDVLSASEANRAKLVELIRSEIDKAAARMGFVREDELAALRARVERLERGSTETAAPEAPTAPKKR